MQSITIETLVAAPTKKAWDYYTLPEHITQWNFADPSWHCPTAENDLRVGGKYKARMEAKDGSFGFDFEAIYTDVETHKKIGYALGDERKVEVFFQPEDDATQVKIIFDAENQNSLELQKNGWQAILDNYAQYTESN
ncbi:MAG: SRPBCC family protein [Bacteroidota bacterium]|nr:SRPBCC family protein [Bacteroidota bacterium]